MTLIFTKYLHAEQATGYRLQIGRLVRKIKMNREK